MQKITPFLWFDTEAEEAANFYVAVFKNSRITHVSRYGDSGPGPKGSVMTVGFELDGHPFTALNGGPRCAFTEAVSFLVRCEDQAEFDHLWQALGQGARSQQYGWITDRYGVTWQIMPR